LGFDARAEIDDALRGLGELDLGRVEERVLLVAPEGVGPGGS